MITYLITRLIGFGSITISEKIMKFKCGFMCVCVCVCVKYSLNIYMLHSVDRDKI
jgi:hypothetical protein